MIMHIDDIILLLFIEIVNPVWMLLAKQVIHDFIGKVCNIGKWSTLHWECTQGK